MTKEAVHGGCVVLGGGGHAAVLIDSIQAGGCADVHAVLDNDPSTWKTELLGVPILGGDDLLPAMIEAGVTSFVVGLGSTGPNGNRRRLFELGVSHDLEPLTVVHPSSVCSRRVAVGRGVQLLPGSIVNARVEIGENAIVNSGAVVEHDCVLGDHVHVATGARLAGHVTVGPGAFIGAGATVKQSVEIGEGAVVGAGSVVLTDVEPHAVVAGIPARPILKGVDA